MRESTIQQEERTIREPWKSGFGEPGWEQVHVEVKHIAIADTALSTCPTRCRFPQVVNMSSYLMVCVLSNTSLILPFHTLYVLFFVWSPLSTPITVCKDLVLIPRFSIE